MKYKNKQITNMTFDEAESFFGKDLFKLMEDTELLKGITCRLNKKKELVIYACDLENALTKVNIGKELFWD